MIGSLDSPIPFHTLFTGMLFIQIFYWSTNQNITQKALAAPNVKEAQKGVVAAAIIRVLIVSTTAPMAWWCAKCCPAGRAACSQR